MATAMALYEGTDLLFAELCCPPDDADWGDDNLVTRPILALPITPVWQSHDGADRQLFNQNTVAFHYPGSEYRRERFRDVGYRCLFLIPTTALVLEMAAEIVPSAESDDVIRFPSSGPLDARTFALSRLAARYLRSGTAPSSAKELLYEVLRGALKAARFAAPTPSPAAPATRRARRELVEAAKEFLTSHLADGISLDDLSRSLHTSPYHLARVFRAATGFSVHGYLVHLRLRSSLERIERPSERIGDVGMDLGFSSPSHFTASFRRAFGLSPSMMKAPAFGDLAI